MNGNKKRNNKNKKKNDQNGEEDTKHENGGPALVYRVKGEKQDDDEDVKGDDSQSPEKDKNKKKDDSEQKNLVYKNPFDFKEKRKFANKWEEYRFGDWRKGQGKTFVTLETEIPELPKNKIEAPDEAAFHKRQVEIDNKIKDLIKEMGDQKDKFSDFLD